MKPAFPFSVLAACAFALSGCGRTPEATLVGWASIPPDSFVTGPTSGQFIEAANGNAPPFEGRQPVQGFSALIRGTAGEYLALPDNGFGRKDNSADFILRVYALRPDFRTAQGGSGTIAVESAFLLRDPNRVIPFPIVADREVYPNSDIPVDPRIRTERLLTGADFDVESFRRVPDGTFYFGDEFGPFLLHTDSTGTLLEPPISLPGVFAPEHPELDGAPPNLGSSSGFEGMALSADGSMLFPILEHSLGGAGAVLNVYAFDLAEGRYTTLDPDSATYRYRLDDEAISVSAFTTWSGDNYLVIERDGGQGQTAKFKRVFLFNPFGIDAMGVLKKIQIIDLLNIADPDDLTRSGTGHLRYDFETTEALVIVDDSTVGIINDNNYPFGMARFEKSGGPDPTEFILVRIRHPD